MLQRSAQYWLRAAVITVSILLLLLILPLIMPFLVSLVMALILLPLVNFIEKSGQRRWRGFPRWAAIVPVFLGVALLAVVMVNYILLPFLSEFTRFVNSIPALTNQVMEALRTWQEENPHMVLPVQMERIINETVVRIGNYSVDLAQKGISAAFSFAGALLELLLVPILTFYMLKDGRELKNSFLHIFPSEAEERIRQTVDKIHRTLGDYFRGQLLLATNMFCIVFIGTYIFSLPYPLVLALLAGIAEWIPIIGPFLGALPAIILASVISGPLAMKVAIFYACVQLIDGQIIMPKVLGHIIRLHPLVILAVIFIGGSLYGVPGMMVAVPFTVILQIIANQLWYFDIYFKRKGE